jgi:hypothetical protein
MSKFAGLFDEPKTSQKKASQPARPKTAAPKRETQSEGKKLGRPAEGKRSNPNYMQGTVYLTKDTRSRVDDVLREERKKHGKDARDFSELVESLLLKWLGDSRT